VKGKEQGGMKRYEKMKGKQKGMKEMKWAMRRNKRNEAGNGKG